MFVKTEDGRYRSLEGVTTIGVEPQRVAPAIDEPGGEWFSVYLERDSNNVLLASREYVGPRYAAEDDAVAAAKLLAEEIGVVELPEESGGTQE